MFKKTIKLLQQMGRGLLIGKVNVGMTFSSISSEELKNAIRVLQKYQDMEYNSNDTLEDMEMLVEEYALCDDGKLTKDAIDLKNRVIAFIEKSHEKIGSKK